MLETFNNYFHVGRAMLHHGLVVFRRFEVDATIMRCKAINKALKSDLIIVITELIKNHDNIASLRHGTTVNSPI